MDASSVLSLVRRSIRCAALRGACAVRPSTLPQHSHAAERSLFRGYRFPPEVIAHAVWLCFRFHVSLRNVQDLLAECGLVVSHESIRHWCGTVRRGRQLHPSAPTSALGERVSAGPQRAIPPLAGGDLGQRAPMKQASSGEHRRHTCPGCHLWQVTRQQQTRGSCPIRADQVRPILAAGGRVEEVHPQLDLACCDRHGGQVEGNLVDAR